MTIKARVHDGRLLADEPTELPEGTELELLPLDPGDWLDHTDRAALHQALRDSDADVTEGRLVDAEELLKQLLARGLHAGCDSPPPHGDTSIVNDDGGSSIGSILMYSPKSSNRR